MSKHVDTTISRRPSWFRRTVIAPAKRAWWVFRLGDFIRVRLELQDQQTRDFRELKSTLLTMAEQQKKLAEFEQDTRQRLTHHEAGPLRASKAELDRRRADGIPRPIEAKRNGGRKRFDAKGTPTDEGPKPA